ncbi:ABC transporter permease [Limibacillus halophilus]|uniref:Putative spermidine/putrescine transport system permease protein n=1 Tax=Limibacillus halophilus TaxID=1579333 RepID=A0A839SNE1_9PROT|nr:ABC transporter permease [Limibacillus halophilus]MBB3064331.1 putative spermidine/putrescine transport system permease protein [Limibacillus halophilus]
MTTSAIPDTKSYRPSAEGLRKPTRSQMSALLAPIATFYGLCLLAPYVYIFWLSLTRYSSSQLYVPDLGLQNYVSILTDNYYLGLLAQTVGLGIFVTVFSLLLGYPLAMRIVQGGKTTKSILLILTMTPLLVNIVVRTYAWLVLLGDNGVINKALDAVGLISEPLPINNNFFSVAIGLIHLSLPLMVISLVSVMEKLDASLIEAGESLGAGSLRTLVKIHIPLCLQGVGAGSLLVFCTVISAFVTPQLLGGNRFSTISTIIYQKFTFSMNWPVGSALVFVLLTLNFAVILLHGFMFREK